jgi:flagellar assembly protein FliH
MDTSQVAFNFADMTAQAKQYLTQIRGEAVKIVAQAQQEAEAIRRQAEQDGRRAALQASEEIIRRQLASVLSALQQAVEEIHHSRQAWLTQWEASGIHVAAAIAQRVVRRELHAQPEISVALLREALELAAGSSTVRVHLNPADRQAMGGQIDAVLGALTGLGTPELIDDPTISRGGCRVDTQFGSIDQQFEAQIARIEEELRP